MLTLPVVIVLATLHDRMSRYRGQRIYVLGDSLDGALWQRAEFGFSRNENPTHRLAYKYADAFDPDEECKDVQIHVDREVACFTVFTLL